MGWARLPDGRSILPSGTILDLGQGDGQYKIIGEPVGYGGSGIIYPAVRVMRTSMVQGQEDRGSWREDPMRVAVKECFPSVRGAALERKDSGEIMGQGAALYDHARRMLQKERSVTAQIYNKGFRLIPLWKVAEEEQISLDGGEHFVHAGNLYGIMERLDEKGVSLGQVLREKESGREPFRAYTGITLIGQVLRALEEVHENGFLHGDIQENNIFLKGGDLKEPGQGEVSLIDFGAARPLLEDGATEAIADQSLYTTNGYTAPECLRGNDGTLRLTPAADIYSVGYLLLRMLTGKAMDPRALQLVVNGKYIYGRQAKKIGCPSSSLEALNKILQKALASDPADRYQTAEEMAADTGRLERALAPKNSAIAAVDYAAFISYCHEEESMEAAEQIQRMIEGYKIPRPLRGEKGQKGLGKVFRDREELSSSGDMEAHIKEALAHSEFLIVLLCPETPGSVWVGREVELFLATHSREQVLTVVVDGDPRETLPEILRKDEKEGQGGIRLQPVEGLAADIRGADKRERKKKLKTEIYRLLAPMLGCGYDDLRQRQREYQLRRAVKTLTAATISLSIIAGYIGWQAYQIHQNYWETMIQRSRYLAQTSAQLLAKGDRMAAIAVALEALPDGEDDHSRPYVGEAEAALSQALYIYRAAQSRSYFLSADRTLFMDVQSQGMEKISADGKRLLAVDEGDTVYLWDVGSGTCERRWEASFWQEEGATGSILYADFLDGDRVLLLTTEVLAVFRIQEQEMELLRGLGQEEDYLEVGTRCAVSRDQGLLAVYRQWVPWSRGTDQDRSLAVYRISDGELICSVPVDTEKQGREHSFSVGELAFSQDGRYLAAPFYAPYITSDEKGTVSGALLTVDLQDGSYELTWDLKGGCSKAVFLDNGDIVTFGYDDDVLGLNNEVDMPGNIACYDPRAGKLLWEVAITCQKKSGHASGLLRQTAQIDGEEKDLVVLWYGRDIRLFDAETGREVWRYSCEKALVGMQPWEQRLIMGTEDGGLYMLYFDDLRVMPFGTNVERRTDNILFDDRTETVFLVTSEDGGGEIVLLKRLEDKDREEVEIEGKLTYFSMCKDKDLYAVCTTDEDGKGALTFYDGNGHREKASVQLEGWMGGSYWLPGEKAIFCYIQEDIGGEMRKNLITAYDVEEQRICWQIDAEGMTKEDIFFREGEEDKVLISYGKRIEIIDLGTGAVEDRIDIVEKGTDEVLYWGAQEVKISPSGRYILMITEEPEGEDSEPQDILRILDREEDQEIELPEEIARMGDLSRFGEFLYPAQKKDQVAIYREKEGQLHILDIKKMEIVQQIPFYAADHRKVIFMPDDQEMLLWGNDLRLKLWDLQEARIKMEDTQLLYQVSKIEVEEEDPFILIEGVDAAHQDYSYGVLNDDHILYRSEEGRFYPYAYLLTGTDGGRKGRIACIDTKRNVICWYDRYTLDDLLEKAREVLGDYTLDETARMRYLMEE